jgi:hypothetical protein
MAFASSYHELRASTRARQGLKPEGSQKSVTAVTRMTPQVRRVWHGDPFWSPGYLERYRPKRCSDLRCYACNRSNRVLQGEGLTDGPWGRSDWFVG